MSHPAPEVFNLPDISFSAFNAVGGESFKNAIEQNHVKVIDAVINNINAATLTELQDDQAARIFMSLPISLTTAFHRESEENPFYVITKKYFTGTNIKRSVRMLNDRLRKCSVNGDLKIIHISAQKVREDDTYRLRVTAIKK